jgi:tetraacyldisaccharide 4'-kinase
MSAQRQTAWSDCLRAQWQQRGWAAWLLWPLHLLMRLLVHLRQSAYTIGWLKTTRLPVPVVVVGNRIVGGAGKTPTVIALVQHLQAQGWTPGILSRGYGRQADPAAPSAGCHVIVDTHSAPQLNATCVGDEPWLMWLRTHAPMGIGSQRASTGQALLAAHPDIDILVCDDGLQHWALSRDLEIVVFDARGAGNGWLLPAGPLREPLGGKRGPGCTQDAWVLYNAASASTSLAGFLAKRHLAPPIPLPTWWQSAATPQTFTPEQALPPLPQPDKPCWAVAGIAQPERFFDSLSSMGYSFTPCPLPDHASFDVWPWPETLTQVFVTEKDAVKIAPERLRQERPQTQVWVVPMRLDLTAAFWQQFNQWLSTHAPQASTLHP